MGLDSEDTRYGVHECEHLFTQAGFTSPSPYMSIGYQMELGVYVVNMKKELDEFIKRNNGNTLTTEKLEAMAKREEDKKIYMEVYGIGKKIATRLADYDSRENYTKCSLNQLESCLHHIGGSRNLAYDLHEVLNRYKAY